MKKARYDAIRIAKELCYNEDTISKIKVATSESEITRILHDAREAMEWCRKQLCSVLTTELKS